MTRQVARRAAHTAAALARATAALTVTLALVVGVPALLVALIGNPFPSAWSWNAPLTNDALLAVVAILAWIFWAQMVLCLGVEIVAELRIVAGHSAEWMSRVPGTFGAQQALARTLVQAVIAVGIGSAAVATPSTFGVTRAQALPASDLHPPAPAVAEQAPQASPRIAATTPTTPRATPTTRTVEVAKGDSLWSLAELHLGSGERWRQIADLNRGRVMPDGQRFRPADPLQPGWTLRVPAVTRPPDRPHSVTVETGDTLWALSQKAYGDGEDWPRIFEANHAQIDDPDLIHPGQKLSVPPARTHHRTVEATHHPPAADPHAPGGREPQDQPGPTQAPVPTPSATSRTTTGAEGARDRTEGADPTPTNRNHGQDESPHHQPRVTDDDTEATLVRALLGGGLLLAGALFAGLLARRRHQFRARRSGRTIAPTPPELVNAERAIRSSGSAGGESCEFLDHALRDLAAQARRDGFGLPEVVAARLGTDSLDLIITHPTNAPDPWQQSTDGSRWTLSRAAAVANVYGAAVGMLAPYPTLVAIGLDPDGATWLVDLEAAGIVQLLGDETACAELARFMAAELATNTWSDDVDVVVTGVADELIPVNPNRLEKADDLDLDRLIKAARRVHEATHATGHDVLAGRIDGRGGDTWMPTILVADARVHRETARGGVDELADELSRTKGRSTVGFVATGLGPLPDALRLTLDPHGRLETPWSPALTANRLTLDEGQTLGRLFASTCDDTGWAAGDPMPPSSGSHRYDQVSDAAGAIRPELTEPRAGDPDPRSLLPEANQTYLTAAATTVEDLEALSPQVPRRTRERTLSADPDLDADLAEWSDPEVRRPRLRLLGPVEVHVAGDRPHEVERRLAYYTEMVAYLATRSQGVSPQQMAEAFSIQTNTLHSRIGTLRKWLGPDEATDTWHLPESTLSEAGKARGVPVYELTGLLCDTDLFKRLRLRGQARGEDGIADLIVALGLVAGTPFDQLRPGGYGWLAETPLDHYLTAGIVDVSHLVATHALASGDTQLAMWAAERGISAAPSEDKPRLDLAKAKSATGNANDADQYVKDEVLNRSDDDDPPPQPTARTAGVLGLGNSR